MSAEFPFEEIIDASKNLYLEVQKKHGVYVKILSQEIIPQTALQKLFSRPKIRVTGFVQNAIEKTTDALQISHKSQDMRYLVEQQVTKNLASFDDIEKNMQNTTQDFLQQESYEGLMQLFDLLRKNDFSFSFIRIVKNYVIENFTLQELKDVALMKKAFFDILEKMLIFYKPQKDIQASQRIITLVGPTGTGKTTTISKLSVEFFVNKNGRKKDDKNSVNLRIVSLDSFKVGAVDQIQKIADVLTVSCECIHDPEELKKYVRKGARPEILFVDTTGQNPKEIVNSDELPLMLAVLKKRNEVLLVVDAVSSEKNLEYIFEAFSVYEYGGVIITKIDEAQSIGTILSVCAKYKVPIAYFGFGQEPCKGLSLATSKILRDFIHV